MAAPTAPPTNSADELGHPAPSVSSAEAALKAALAGYPALQAMLDALLQDERAKTETERTAKEEAFVELFMTKLMAIGSSNAAESPSRTDSLRRGAPTPVLAAGDDNMLELELPSVADSEVKAAWEAFCAAQAAAPGEEFAKSHEDKRVHPTVARLLNAATGTFLGQLRLWHKKIAADSINEAEISPDFCFTHVRDCSLSLHGTLLAVEVKHPTAQNQAEEQACVYGRRRIRQLCEVDREAGRLQAEPIAALVVATDGLSVTVIRINSGVPPAGTSFERARPCSTFQSTALPLLEKWDGKVAPEVPSDPPAGFAALMRAVRAAATQSLYCPSIARPLKELRVCLEQGDGSSRPIGGARGPLHVLALGGRLGCGGSSDVYALADVSAGGEGAAGRCDCSVCVIVRRARSAAGIGADANTDVVVKVARAAAELRIQAFAEEVAALRAVHDTAPIASAPRVLAAGCCAEQYPREFSQPVPVLLLSPAAQPLHRWVASIPPEHRLQCADKVASAVLVALQRAHAAGWAHCDVRPSNVVVVVPSSASSGASSTAAAAPALSECQVILADWGAARRFGENLLDCGSAAYVHDGVPLQDPGQESAAPPYKVDARVDLHATAHLWLAVAYGTVTADAALPGVSEIMAWANAPQHSYVLPTRS